MRRCYMPQAQFLWHLMSYYDTRTYLNGFLVHCHHTGVIKNETIGCTAQHHFCMTLHYLLYIEQEMPFEVYTAHLAAHQITEICGALLASKYRFCFIQARCEEKPSLEEHCKIQQRTITAKDLALSRLFAWASWSLWNPFLLTQID